MVQLVRHRQTKGPATDRFHLNHRATSRLYSSLGCVPVGIGGVLSGSEPSLPFEDLTPSECELYFDILAVHDFPSHDHVFH